MRLPDAPENILFTHATTDTIAGTRVFCTESSTECGGVPALALGCAVFAPARALSITEDRLGILLQIRPERTDGVNIFLAKGLDQYRIYQPDTDHLSFSVFTDTRHTVTVALPAGWYDAWHTLVATYSGEALSLAIDGQCLGTTPATGSIRYFPGTLMLGHDPFTGTAGRAAVALLRMHTGDLESLSDDVARGATGEDCVAQVRFGALQPGTPADTAPPSPLSLHRADEPAAAPAPGPALDSLPGIEIHEKDNVGYFKGEGFDMAIDLPTATITSWQLDGEELLDLGPIHQFWRPPRFDEICPGDNSPPIAMEWISAGLMENIMGVTAMEALQDRPSRVVLKFQGLIIRRNSDVLFEVQRNYTIFGNGEVLLEQTLTPKTPLPALGRAGLELRLPLEFHAITQPAANSDADPIQWISMCNSEGTGLLVWGEVPFRAEASSFSPFQRTEAIYPATLTPDAALTLHVDLDRAPGNESPSNPLRQSLRLRGLRANDTPARQYVATDLPIEKAVG